MHFRGQENESLSLGVSLGVHEASSLWSFLSLLIATYKLLDVQRKIHGWMLGTPGVMLYCVSSCSVTLLLP